MTFSAFEFASELPHPGNSDVSRLLTASSIHVIPHETRPVCHNNVMQQITLHGNWLVKAPLEQVFNIMTDFEKFPMYFPKVAESIRVTRRKENYLEMEAGVKSLGKLYPVTMKTQIIPGKGFVSDNDSPGFGTSGHEEFLLSESPVGTRIDYTYQVSIHRFWLGIVAGPLIRWYLMRYWEKAVIDRLRKMLEK